MKVSKSGNRNLLLAAAYAAMIAVFIWLNFFAETNTSKVSIVISVCMLLIAGLIIFISLRSYLQKLDDMIRELHTAANEIRRQGESSQGFLWESYQENVVLFQTDELKNTYLDYLQEMKRLRADASEESSCDIEDYLNYNFLDRTIHKGLLNLIPGVMTGLGILGTFIGLSLGLQHFNTDTADEISNSIASLMDGIKVAFHTSIYGMVLSLVFNYVYKKKLEDGYQAVDAFTTAWKSYVYPDSDHTDRNQTLSYQKQMAESMQLLSVHHEQEMGQLRETVTEFARLATEGQKESMEQMISVFLGGLNASLEDRFSRLGQVLDELSQVQEQNTAALKKEMDWITAASADLHQIHEETERSITAFSDFSVLMKGYQEQTNAMMEELERQLHQNGELTITNQEHYEKLASYVEVMAGAASEQSAYLQKQAKAMQELGHQTTQEVEDCITVISAQTRELTAFLKEETALMTDALKISEEGIRKSAINASQEIEGSAARSVAFIRNSQQEAISDNEAQVDRMLTKLDRNYEAMMQSMLQNQEKMAELMKSLQTMQDQKQG